jgi:hypothetical protein
MAALVGIKCSLWSATVPTSKRHEQLANGSNDGICEMVKELAK